MIVQAARGLLNALGFEAVKQRPPRRWQAAFLAQLARPKTVFDVGAGYGTNGLYGAYPEAEFFLLEPIADYRPQLEAIARRYRCRILEVAAGAEEATREIALDTRIPTRTSLMERTALTFTGSVLEPRRIHIRPLDAILAEHPDIAPPVLLKIDTEGYELEVIKGATQLLRITDTVIAEVSVAQRFHGSYTFAELVRAADENGFELFDFVKVRYIKGAPGLKSVDAVFRKRSS